MKEEKDVVEVISYNTRAGVSAHAQKVNQDNYFYQKDFAGLKGLWIFGVMDGHGIVGHKVSGYVRNHLPQTMAKMIKG
jgi:serine/threonine protein phosphatase PrpC